MAKKIFFSLASIILAASIVFIGCFCGIPQFNTWTKNLFKSGVSSGASAESGNTTDGGDGTNSGDDDGTVSASGTHFLMEVDDNERIQVAAAYSSRVSAGVATVYSDGGYSITANVNPLYADVREVNWTMFFKNPDSAWASGKSVWDYISYTEADDTINVTCLDAFGEPIVIRCSSVDNPDIYADCTCDYVKRVEGITFSNLLSFPESSFTYAMNYTAYTIDSSVAFSLSSSIYLSDAFCEHIENTCQGNLVYGIKCDNRISIRADYTSQTITAENPNLSSWVSTTEDTSDDVTTDDLSRLVRVAISTWDDDMGYCQASCVCSYNGQSYSTFSQNVWLRFDYNSIKIPVSSLTLSTEHIIF